MDEPVRVLDVPVMTAREAARQLKMPPATLSTWLEGRSTGRKFYEPVLRPEPLGHFEMTWGEFVEAGYLRAYRSKVPLQRLRPFIKAVREEFEVPYPLAHFKPFVGKSRELLLRLQVETDVPDDLWLVMRGPHGQYLLNPVVEQDYLQRIDFADHGLGEAQRVHPMGKDSPVVFDPRRSSGAASVRGVRCEVLVERVDAGEPVEEVAEEFGLEVAEVKAAAAYVWSTAA